MISYNLLSGCMLCSLIPCHARGCILQSPSGKQFNNICDAFRGEASIFAEPMEDYDILVRPFVPFGTCSWGSQLHTAIIAVW